MFFYGWWNPAYLLLLGLSVLANWSFGLVLAHCLRLRGDQAAGRLLWLGIAMNLLLIGYYKYAGFFAGSINGRSEEHTSELQSLMRISYAVFCLKKKK